MPDADTRPPQFLDGDIDALVDFINALLDAGADPTEDEIVEAVAEFARDDRHSDYETLAMTLVQHLRDDAGWKIIGVALAYLGDAWAEQRNEE